MAASWVLWVAASLVISCVQDEAEAQVSSGELKVSWENCVTIELFKTCFYNDSMVYGDKSLKS